MWGPAIVMVCVVRPSVCLSHANISETKRDRHVVTRKLEYETELPDSESAIGSTVPPFWVFLRRHFDHADRNGPVGLVNGSVGTVTSRHHTGHRGGPAAIVTSHNGRYLVQILCYHVFGKITLKKHARNAILTVLLVIR